MLFLCGLMDVEVIIYMWFFNKLLYVYEKYNLISNIN